MDNGSDRIQLTDDTWLLVLTGAGVSAESGIPTFRDAGGLWEKVPVQKVASPHGFANDPLAVWRFYSERRKNALACRPNPGHDALAALEARLGDRLLVATQNIDGLHQKAGSTRVVEMHGSLFKTRCSVCDRPAFEDVDIYDEKTLPACGKCIGRGGFALLRPHIVWFGEALDSADVERIEKFARAAAKHRFVFLAVGTSGAVYPAADLVNQARDLGADTWLVNADAPDNAARFAHFVQGPSGKILPGLFA